MKSFNFFYLNYFTSGKGHFLFGVVTFIIQETPIKSVEEGSRL